MKSKAKFIFFTGDKKIELIQEASALRVDGKIYCIDIFRNSSGACTITNGNKTFRLYCKKVSETEYDIWIKHHVLRLTVEDQKTTLINKYKKNVNFGALNTSVKAPMPGLITRIEVKIGEIVQPGQGLLVLEAMKMENEIRSSSNCIIKEIKVSDRMTVEKDQELFIIESLNSNLSNHGN
jgi:biotin carboxyl carrier protein